ncbi:MAG: tetratricopeptide repeat protein [Lysobacteraceae bacterium]
MTTDMSSVARLRGHFERDPENPDLACALVDAHWAAGDAAGARALFASFAQCVSDAPGVRFRRARAALIGGEYAEAEAILFAMIADGEDGAAVRHDLAFAQLCMRRMEDATATLASAIDRFGASPQLLVLRARISSVRGEFPLAVSAATDALALDPEDAAAFGVLALAQLDRADEGAAEKAARAALARDPAQHEALLVMSTLSLWRMDLDNANALLERALEGHPGSGRALSGLGQLLMLRNDLARAKDILERAVIAMPGHIGTWHALAWACLLQGRIDEAERCYRRAYDIDRNFGDTHGGLALVAVLRGDLDEAEHASRRALRLDPDAQTARYAQALLLEVRGDHAAYEARIAALLPDRHAPGMSVADFAQRLKVLLTGAGR